MSDHVVVQSLASDAVPAAAIAERLRSRGIAIVEEQPNMLLVAGTARAVSRALGRARGWEVAPVTTVPRPRTRMRVLSTP